MRAIRLHGFGPPEVLVAEEVAAPSAGSGQALVEVAFANITFAETQFRAAGFGRPRASSRSSRATASAGWWPRSARGSTRD